MSSVSTSSALAEKVADYLRACPGDTVCPRQIWYEGLHGCGVPTPETLSVIADVMAEAPDWKSVGTVRFEKYGDQPSYGRKEDRQPKTKAGRIMPQHLFKVNSLYKAPDGKVYKVVLSEVYNLRCFEVADGNLVGPMVKIHPASELAKALTPVNA